jgi:serine/threonine-protein kinase
MQLIRRAVIPEPERQDVPLPQKLSRIIKRALAKRREDRYQSAADMQMDLEEYLRSASQICNSIVLGEYFTEHYRKLRQEPTAAVNGTVQVGKGVSSPARGTVQVGKGAHSPARGTVQVEKGARSPARGTLQVAKREATADAAVHEMETEILEGSDLDQQLIGSGKHVDLSEPDASDVMETSQRSASGIIFSQPTDPKIVSPLESTATVTARDDDDTGNIDLAETVALRPSGELAELEGLTTVDARSSTHRLPRSPAYRRTRSARVLRRRMVVIGLIAIVAITGALVGFWISDPGEDPTSFTGVPDLTSLVSQAPAEASVDQNSFDAFSYTATLAINSKPAGASIRINGVPITEVTPLEHTLALGTHKVEASYIGFENQVQQVTVEQGQTIKLNFVLRPEALPTPKMVEVVQIRKSKRPRGKPSRRKKRWSKKRKRTKPKPKHRQPTIAARGSTSKVPARPEALSYGFLTVNTVPWSRVFLNGKLIGTTPLANVRVIAGTHKLRFVNPSGPVAHRTAVVRTGMVTKLRFNLPQ